MLIGADTFLTVLEGERICWIGGRLRSGKTCLAYRISYEELTVRKNGFRYLLSNVSDVWSDEIVSIKARDNYYLDTIVILDEGGLFLEKKQDANEVTQFLGKLNNLLLVSSRRQPNKDICKLQVYRSRTLEVVGVNVWVFGWLLETGKYKEKGSFYWINPSEIWGVFDTVEVIADDQGIMDFLYLEKEKRLKRKVRKYGVDKITVSSLDGEMQGAEVSKKDDQGRSALPGDVGGTE